MMTTKYPEWVEEQLKIIDERIEEIYKEYEGLKISPDEAMRIKRNLYERIKPFVDEKVRLISNSCPTYIVDGMSKAESEDKEYEVKVITRGNCMMCGKELTEGLFLCKECGEKANKESEEEK